MIVIGITLRFGLYFIIGFGDGFQMGSLAIWEKGYAILS